MAAHRIRRDGVQAAHLTAQESDEVDLVDQVDQHGTAAGGSTPRWCEEGIRLEESRQHIDGDDPAEYSLLDQRPGFLSDRVVPPVMAYEDRYIETLRSFR